MIEPADRECRIFIPGLYTWANKGDAALVMSFLPWISSVFKTNTLTLTSFTPQGDASHYGYPVLDMIIRPGARIHRRSANIASRVRGAKVALTAARMAYTQLIIGYLAAWGPLYLRYPRVAGRFVPEHVLKVARAIIDADDVISIPGGYLNALRHTDDLWLFHLPTLRLAYSLGKPPVLGPCSIGPFTWAHRGFARGALLRARLILVREDESMAILRRLGIPESKLLPTPDMAFALEPEPNSITGKQTLARVMDFAARRDILGVSVRSHSFPGHADPEKMQREYLRHVAEAVGELAKDEDAVVVIVPQTMEDIPIGRRLAGILSAGYPLVPYIAVEEDLSPSDLVSLYSRFRLLVGTRMHANILAMGTGTPVAAIAYELKTMGILQRMGLPDWGVNIDQLSDDRLKALVRRQWDGAESLGLIAHERSMEQREQLTSIDAESVFGLNRELPRASRPRAGKHEEAVR